MDLKINFVIDMQNIKKLLLIRANIKYIILEIQYNYWKFNIFCVYLIISKAISFKVLIHILVFTLKFITYFSANTITM